MSLINDALKRAKQAQQKNDPPPPGTPLRPAEGRRGAAPHSALLPLLLAAGLIVIGGILIVIAMTRSEPKQFPSSVPVAANSSPARPLRDGKPAFAPQAEQPKPAPAPVTPAAIPPAVEPTTSTPSITTQEIAVAAAPTHTPATAPTPALPAVPKLQGIFFNPSRPSAVVSGKTVYVGSHVGEFSVIAITQQAVTVARGGETNVLTLEE
jgi:hypothetical protein